MFNRLPTLAVHGVPYLFCVPAIKSLHRYFSFLTSLFLSEFLFPFVYTVFMHIIHLYISVQLYEFLSDIIVLTSMLTSYCRSTNKITVRPLPCGLQAEIHSNFRRANIFNINVSRGDFVPTLRPHSSKLRSTDKNIYF